jgi:hypothetical protein
VKSRKQRNQRNIPPLKGGGNVTLPCYGVLREMLRNRKVYLGFWGSVTRRNKKRNKGVTEPCYADYVKLGTERWQK